MAASKLLIAASMALAVAAGPCRPSPSRISSYATDISLTSTFSISQSTVSADSTHDASTTTTNNMEHETTASTPAMSLFTSTTLSFESTATVSVASTESNDIASDTTTVAATETTIGSTTEATSTKETTIATSETTTEGATSTKTGATTTEITLTTAESATTTEATTVTTDGTTTTTEATTTTTEATTATEETTTTIDATTTTAAESTAESSTTSIETTTTTSMAPISTTFNLVIQGGTMGNGLVAHSDGQQVQIRNGLSAYPFTSAFPEAALSYDHNTQHLLLGNKPLCVMYGTIGYEAALRICQGEPTGQYGYLTCNPPSDGGLTCSIPGKQATNSGLVDLGQTWSQFYLLGINRTIQPGMYVILIGRDDLSTDQIKYQDFEKITIGTQYV